MSNSDWLNNLSVGDKVMVSSSHGKPIQRKFYDAQVVSVNKNGDITIVYVNQADETRFKFDKNGNRKGMKFYPDCLVEMQ